MALSYRLPKNFEEVRCKEEKFTIVNEDMLVDLAIQQVGIDVEQYPYQKATVGKLAVCETEAEEEMLDETKLQSVMEIIDRLAVIFDEEDFENDDVVKKEISELESKLIDLTGKNIEQCQPFRNYWAYTDLETVVRKILSTKPQKENLSDEQLYEIFENIVNVCQDEAETDYLLEVLKTETGIEDVEDYIYCPDEIGLGIDASDEDIFQKILADRK